MTKKVSFKKLVTSDVFVLLLILVAFFMIGALTKGSSFLNRNNMANILRSGSMAGILGLGATALIIVGEFDLSMGATLAFSCCAAAQIMTTLGKSYEMLGIVLTIVFGALVGVCNGLLVTKAKIKSLMATLGMMTVLNGCAQWVSKGLPIYLYGYSRWTAIGQAKVGLIPVPVFFFAAIAVILSVLYGRTVIGKKIYFTGANPRAAYLCGINTDALKILGFVICGMCAAVAGLILCAINDQAINTIATGQEMTGMAVAVLGGTMLGGGRGSMLGTVVGTFVYQLLLNVLALSGMGTYTEQTMKGAIVILIVVVYQVINDRRRRAA